MKRDFLRCKVSNLGNFLLNLLTHVQLLNFCLGVRISFLLFQMPWLLSPIGRSNVPSWRLVEAYCCFWERWVGGWRGRRCRLRTVLETFLKLSLVTSRLLAGLGFEYWSNESPCRSALSRDSFDCPTGVVDVRCRLELFLGLAKSLRRWLVAGRSYR